MKKYMHILRRSSIFAGMDETEIRSILTCLTATTVSYKRGSFIIRAGDRISSVGLVLSGSVHIIKEDYWGNRSILSKCDSGSLFGEVYAVLGREPVGVSAVAAEETVILFLEMQRLLTVCGNGCEFHSRLIRNLMRDMAGKNMALTHKIEHMSHRTTRDKLISNLSEQAMLSGSGEFEIPFNRQQLADYLSVDRSAMSKELCRMRDEGIVEFNRSTFRLRESM